MSDIERQSNISSYSDTWKDRTRLIASLILPEHTVIEFGAGTNPISKYLPDNICKITDFVDKGDLKFNHYDLNSSKLIDFGRYDYAVFSGVLEYITFLPRKIKYVANRCDNIIASYGAIEEYPNNRSEIGWVNSYSNDDIIKIFKEAGMRLDTCILWKKMHIKPSGSEYSHNQRIYKFIKDDI